MTPGARVAAAIEILDEILGGRPAEQSLTNWSRRSRFAGSKDRAAVRDHVFEALRCKRSFAALGGAMTGRGLMIGALRAAGSDEAELFSGIGHAPAPIGPEDPPRRDPKNGPEALDLPDWLWPRLHDTYGDRLTLIAHSLQTRAPVHLRVNLRKAGLEQARDLLAEDGIETVSHPAAATALEVIQGNRRLRQSRAYQTGVVELQDAASQAVVETLPLADGQRVLDFCAGGGGKALAMAARADLDLWVHDKHVRRMNDLPERARRADARISLAKPNEISGPFDLVLCDVPCSGSGAWRRNPEGKWLINQNALDQLIDVQTSILDEVTAFVSAKGTLAYATCSLLPEENQLQTNAFLDRFPAWTKSFEFSWTPENGTDGFYCAHLTRL